MQQWIAIGDIVASAAYQMREKLCQTTVAEYAELITAEDPWPFATPLTAYKIGKEIILVDGFHRLAAAKQIDQEAVLCEVIDGTRTDALKAALSANITHGLRRSNSDKRRAVTMAIEDIVLGKMSDRKLAELCGVSDKFVGVIRGEVRTVRTSPPEKKQKPSVNVGSDGKAYPATKEDAMSQRERVSTAIFTEPEASDREIAQIVGCDHKTVASVRREIKEVQERMRPENVMRDHTPDEPEPDFSDDTEDSDDFDAEEATSRVQQRVRALVDSELSQWPDHLQAECLDAFVSAIEEFLNAQ